MEKNPSEFIHDFSKSTAVQKNNTIEEYENTIKERFVANTLQIKSIGDFDQLVSERTELSKPVLSIRLDGL